MKVKKCVVRLFIRDGNRRKLVRNVRRYELSNGSRFYSWTDIYYELENPFVLLINLGIPDIGQFKEPSGELLELISVKNFTRPEIQKNLLDLIEDRDGILTGNIDKDVYDYILEKYPDDSDWSGDNIADPIELPDI